MTDNLPEPKQVYTNPSAELADTLARVDNAVGRFQKLHQAGRILSNSFEAIRAGLIYHSNAIEGSSLTLRDTHLIIEGREPNTGKSLQEIYEARNHDRALRLIETWVRNEPDAPLTEKHLLDLHAHILADIDPAKLRLDRIGTHPHIFGTRRRPVRFAQFSGLFPRLNDMIHRPNVHPLVTAAELHNSLFITLLFIGTDCHMARLIMNWLLLQHGYPLTIIPETDTETYSNATFEACNGRPEPFALFLAKCVIETIEQLIGEGA